MDEEMMREALKEAQQALELSFMPVGAVMVRNGEIIARSHKTMGSNHLDHAETNLLRQILQGEYNNARNELTVYTTLEPCLMCYGTMRHCPVGRLVYALEDPYGGAAHVEDRALPIRHHSRPLEVRGGVLREDAKAMFRRFLQTTKESFWLNGGARELQKIILAPSIE